MTPIPQIIPTTTCSISFDEIVHPGICFPCGHQFEASEIQTWLSNSSICPLDRQQVEAVCTSPEEFEERARSLQQRTAAAARSFRFIDLFEPREHRLPPQVRRVESDGGRFIQFFLQAS